MPTQQLANRELLAVINTIEPSDITTAREFAQVRNLQLYELGSLCMDAQAIQRAETIQAALASRFVVLATAV